jgi:hypothetical protein
MAHFFTPYLGVSKRSRPRRSESDPRRTLNVALALEKKIAIAAAEVPDIGWGKQGGRIGGRMANEEKHGVHPGE